MAGFWEDILSGGVQAGAIYDIAGNIRDEGKDVADKSATLANDAVAGTTFTPYTVTSNTGNVGMNGTDVNLALTPEQQQLADTFSGGAQTFAERSLGDTAGREQDIYNRMAAVQDPQIARDRLEMESRMAAQGRLGVASDAYGGIAPELFGMEKAIQEGRNGLSVSAMEQARLQQLQDANIGTNFLNSSYQPTNNLLETFNPALQYANLNQTGQIAGQNLSSQLNLGGMQTKVNADLVASNLYGGLFNSLGNVAGSFGGRMDSAQAGGAGMWDSVKTAFGL